MIGYRDRIWCKFYSFCERKDDCDKVYTEEVHKDACKWWGNNDPPVWFFIKCPGCFKRRRLDEKL